MKNVLQLFILLMAVVLLAVSCKSNKEVTNAGSSSETVKDQLSNKPQLLASIERTACYGQCPMYKARFMDNGEVIYVGRRFVEKVGTYKGLISTEEIQAIKDNVKKYEYFSLDSLYPTPITDFPSCLTEVRLEGKSKKVINRRSPPENLRAFEKYLDGLLEEVALEKISDETNYDVELK